MINFLLAVILMFFPSRLKIFVLRRRGAVIGKTCRIGFSIVMADDFEIGDNVFIGNFNLIWKLKCLTMKSGSRINTMNWITGARDGSFSLGSNSSVSVMHYFEVSADIFIGNDTIIAGRSSQFFTHGIRPNNLNDLSPINIGAWCYIGTASRFAPGSAIPDNCFVGMGAVVTRKFECPLRLIGGCPAKEIKLLEKDAVFFDRPYLPQPHHVSR